MKVLHVSTWKQRCGIADFAESMVTHLAPLGVENEVAPIDLARTQYMTSDEFLLELDRIVAKAARCDLVHVQHEFSLFTGSGGLGDSIGYFAHLLSGLRTIRRSVVVTFHTEPTFSTLLPVPGLPAREEPAGRPRLSNGSSARFACVARPGGLNGFGANEWHRFLRQTGLSESFRALAPTPRTALGLVNSGCARESVVQRPHGIVQRDASYRTIGRDEARVRLGLPADSVLLTIFGFVAAYKGHRLAVDALKKLPAKYRLAIVGGPSPVDAADLTLNSIFETWEQEDPRRLHVTGYASRETIDLYHAATDICLAPFRPEFYSGSASIGWALSSGKPIIATNIPAFAEIQREGDCLLMCTPNSVHELAWNIQRLAGDPQMQHRLAHNALAYAERHSWQRVSRGARRTLSRDDGHCVSPPWQGGQRGRVKMFYRFPYVPVTKGAKMLHEGNPARQQRRDERPTCQHSAITVPRDPPCPPFLRGGVDMRRRLGQTVVACQRTSLC